MLQWLVSLVGPDGSSSSEERTSKNSAVRFGRFRRSSRKSGGSGAGGAGACTAGNYQLHSFGRDKEACKFGDADGRSTTVTSRSDTLRTPDDLSVQKGGILVTTSTTWKASDGDASSEGILTGSDEESGRQYRSGTGKMGNNSGSWHEQ